MHKYSGLVTASALIVMVSGVSAPVMAQTVASPTTTWNAITYGGVIPSDPIADQQTGQPTSDIVGDASNPFLYTLFENAGTSSNTDGTLYFRLRLNQGGASFKGTALVGFSFTSNASSQPVINLFAGIDNSGSPDRIAIFRSDPTKTNISPSTSGVGAVITSYAETSANYYYSAVTATNQPTPGSPFNFDSGSTADYFLGFAIPFSDLVSAASAAGAGGITDTSQVRFIAFTATQPNTLNQDIGGYNDKTGSPALPFSDLGIISDPTTASALTPTPAPPGVISGLIGIGMGGAQFGLMKFRRRRRAKKTETTEATDVVA